MRVDEELLETGLMKIVEPVFQQGPACDLNQALWGVVG
jgi:hypothetical protein